MRLAVGARQHLIPQLIKIHAASLGRDTEDNDNRRRPDQIGAAVVARAVWVRTEGRAAVGTSVLMRWRGGVILGLACSMRVYPSPRRLGNPHLLTTAADGEPSGSRLTFWSVQV